jgi:hypothetical protein
MVRWIGRGGTVQGFKAILIAEYETCHPLSTEKTITV